MPELPEVETVVRELTSLEGKIFRSVQAHWDKSVEGETSFFQSTISGQKIEKVFRRGKYICLSLHRGDVISVHLRMTGKMVFEPSERDLNYNRVEFAFKDQSKIYFIDIRKFGRIKLWPKSEPFMPDLGPEPLESDDVLEALKNCRSQREIKKVLLDQSVLVGVGNIYADESLFLSKIHPEKTLKEISSQKLKTLSKTIPEVLHRSINNMGTTLSDYRNTKNVGGENQNYLMVYGQTDQPCKTCGSKIKRILVGQRSTHFCPRCQKRS